ncbi:MAG: AbrB/MazE/SpoVT family DNA-binding domain-containing protein [Deltaproteobacteria bacterium]|nr:AbrB/MazE/SpoVT family DNA-binding domain-containing protein [Deltaproteobacteria bacterium]
MLEFIAAPKTARIRARGQLTIPQDIREALNLDEHASVNIFRVGKVLLMTPKRLQRASLSRDVEKEMKREGLTLKDLLKELKEQRRLYFAETYPQD